LDQRGPKEKGTTKENPKETIAKTEKA